MHDGLWNEILNRLPGDAKVAPYKTSNQGRFHLLLWSKLQLIVSALPSAMNHPLHAPHRGACPMTSCHTPEERPVTPYLFFSQIFLGTSQPCDPDRGRANLPIATTSVIAMPMEPEYTANFDFNEWMANHNMTGEGAIDRTYTFAIPEDFPAYLAGIPAVSSSIPFIGSCTLGPGFGEPSVS